MRPDFYGRLRADRVRHLKAAGCPEHLIGQADDDLLFVIRPREVPTGWRVMARLSDLEARRVVRQVIER